MKALALLLVLAQDVPNASLKQMYETRAARQRAQGNTALVVGVILLGGGVLAGAFLRTDERALSLGLPWTIESSLLGACTLLGSLAADGKALRAKADALAPDGTTPLNEIIADERKQYQGSGRVLAISLGVGAGLTALGTVLIAATPHDEGAWKSSGAAVLTLGVIIATLGVFIWNETQQALKQLDRGVIEDLDVVNPRP